MRWPETKPSSTLTWGRDVTDAVLACRGLSAGYGGVDAINDVTIEGQARRVTAIIGPNGAGKSTLLNTLAGLITPTSGTVSLLGEDITTVAAYERARRGIAQVPEGRGILARLSVAENLQLALDWANRSESGPTDLAAQLDHFPILRDRFRMPAANLSGGEQQMLALARAVLMKPKALLLDEPSLGLAPLIVDDVYAQLRRLRDEGQTIILVEQMVRKTLDLADDVYVLARGSIQGYGTAQEMKDDPHLIEAYLPIK